jgi:hypothetical protein
MRRHSNASEGKAVRSLATLFIRLPEKKVNQNIETIGLEHQPLCADLHFRFHRISVSKNRRSILVASTPLLRESRLSQKESMGESWRVTGDSGRVRGEAKRVILQGRPVGRLTPSASAARHQPDRQPSKLMLNFGSWAGRLHAVLGGVPL